MTFSNSFDRTIYSLCEEIDYWKEQAEYYKAKYEEEIKETSRHLNERLNEAKKGVANVILLSLSVADNPDGSLSISSENRKFLSENIKS